MTTFLLIDVFDLAPTATHAYWTQDDVQAGAAHWGQDPNRLLLGESKVAAEADLILAASPLAAERWNAKGFTAFALPNGCDISRFENLSRARIDAIGLQPPIAGFVGHLNERTNIELLESVVAHGLSLLIVGPMSNTQPSDRLQNLLGDARVRAVGPQPYDDLGYWLGAVDVGLVPYRLDEFNRLSFPLKVLEYLAAGLPVVTTDLPAVRWLDCPHAYIAQSASQFGRQALAASALGASPALALDRQNFARSHTWAQRARSLAQLLNLAKID